MGTRNLTVVIKDGRHVVAQYGQFDGYPAGQGLNVLKFLRNEYKAKLFASRLNNVKFMSDDEYEAEWDRCGYVEQNWQTHDAASEKFGKRHPLLSRRLAGEVLSAIQQLGESDHQYLRDNLNFAAEGLFCEWAYVVDLDKKMFEVYQSISRSREEVPYNQCGTERFASLDCAIRADYPPVRRVVSYSLLDLPTQEEFLATSSAPNRDEDAE